MSSVHPIVAALARRHAGHLARWALLAGAVIAGIPVLLCVLVVVLFTGSPHAQCPAASTTTTAAPVGLVDRAASGAGNVLVDTPTPPLAAGGSARGCAPDVGAGAGPLPVIAGDHARLLADGRAAAPQDAPSRDPGDERGGQRDRRAPLPLRRRHGLPLDELSAAYDCSSSAGHVLYGAGLLDSDLAPTSGQLTAYGQAGYGAWCRCWPTTATSTSTSRACGGTPTAGAPPIPAWPGSAGTPPNGPTAASRHVTPRACEPHRAAADRLTVLVVLAVAAGGAAACTTHTSTPPPPRPRPPVRRRGSSTSRSSPAHLPRPPERAPTSGAAPSATAAIERFAALYVNWTYRTIAEHRRRLAAMAVGQAAAAQRRAVAQVAADSQLRQGQVTNTGTVVSLARDRTGPGDRFVVVTRETTNSQGAEEGLPAGYHVTLATVQRVPGGFAVSRWEPQT